MWSRLPKPEAIADACGRALRRTLPALVGIGVLSAIGGTAWASYHFATTSDRFAITRIDITGNHQLSTDAIRATLPARVGDNVFATNLDAIVRELGDNPWIASAQARRELPHTIAIDVREHVPVALVQLGELYLVDSSGHAFKRAILIADEGSGLPIITGLDRTEYIASPDVVAAQIRAALAALASWQQGADRPAIGEVNLNAHGALALITYERAFSIELGTLDGDLALRMQTFDAIWAELDTAERARVRAIHLDARSDQVTVAFAPKDL